MAPTNPQNRKCFRVVTGSDVSAFLWLANGPLMEPPKAERVEASVRDVSVGGIGLLFGRAEHERLKLAPGHEVGMIIELEGHRLVCRAETRHVRELSNGTVHAGLRFMFEFPEHRRMEAAIESIVAELNRAQLRRAAIYGRSVAAATPSAGS